MTIGLARGPRDRAGARARRRAGVFALERAERRPVRAGGFLLDLLMMMMILPAV